MDALQTTFDEEALPIQILGVNGVGYESGNERATEGRDIPWLQDTEDVDAWTLWDVRYRDVYVVDREGNLRFIYNLTTHDLSNPVYMTELTEAISGLLE